MKFKLKIELKADVAVRASAADRGNICSSETDDCLLQYLPYAMCVPHALNFGKQCIGHLPTSPQDE